MFHWPHSGMRQLLFCLACAVVVCLFAWRDPLLVKRVDLALFDQLQTRVEPPPPEQKVVAVLASERSMMSMRQWPWPRSYHARLLERLHLAKTVALDILMPELSDPAEDRQLVEAVARSGNVVQAIHLVPGDGGTNLPLLPFTSLAMNVADAGITNIPAEPDGIYRDAYLYWTIAGELVASLPTAVWTESGHPPPVIEKHENRYDVRLSNRTLRTDLDLAFKIHHPKQEIPVYEYVDVFNGIYPEETFRDAIVVVGVNAAGATDYFPIGRSRVLPGSLYNAHAILTLMHGWIPVEAPVWIALVVAGVLAAVGAAIGFREGIGRGWLWALAILLLWALAMGCLFFLKMTWLAPMPPALGLVGSFILATFTRMRRLAGELNVSHLSIKNLYFLDGGAQDGSEPTHAEYLSARWPAVRQWSGIELVAAYADENDPEVQAIARAAAERDTALGVDGNDDRATIIQSRGEGRMSLRLPDTAEGVRKYAVLSWRGHKSEGVLQSASVLVLASALHFKALEEARARRELFLSVIRLIMGAVDAKDPTTAGHSERVADLGRELARQLGLPGSEVDEIYLAGLLHDVGKIGIPDTILNFPGRLSDDDMAVMRRHPDIGIGIMEKITLSPTVRAGIVEHHERLDGKGYPKGITADQLSQAGKILKIADVYDALISKRQYKDAMPKEKVYAILSQGAGTDFDPELLDMFLTWHFPEFHEKVFVK